MKKIVVFLIFVFVFAVPVDAQNQYQSQYENSNAESIENALDEKTGEFLKQNGIDTENPEWVGRLTESNVLSHIWEFITSGAKTPVKTGILTASIIFLTAAFTTFGQSARFETAVYASVLSISAFVAVDIWKCVEAAVNAIKACSTFMLSFVPVFAGIVAMSGKVVTAPAMSTLLLGAAEVVSYVSSFTVLPLMGGYLSLSICSGVSPLLNGSGITESVKKLSMWILSLLSTLFVGVLGIQTAVNSAADSVTLRTAKFILGTSVPVAGSVLSEAVSTISTSIGLLRSSIGIYGVVALIFLLLPIVVELILWRCVLMLNICLGEMFALPKITGILRAIDSMLSVLLGVVLIVGGMFIISLSVIVAAGKT